MRQVRYSSLAPRGLQVAPVASFFVTSWSSWLIRLAACIAVAICGETIAVAQADAERAPARATPAGRLPWESRAPDREPVLRPPSGPAELLERYDIAASQLENFLSGQPMTPAEEDVLVKILYRLPRLGLANLERWRRGDITWDQLAAAPKDFRLEVLRVSGRVKRVERQSLLPEQAALYEFDHFYRVTFDIDDAPYQAMLLARRVPAAWKLDEPIDEPAAADGLFLKLGDSTAEQPPLIFAAGHVSWFPDQARPDLGLGAPQLALAELGFDAGLWELVHEANATPLSAVDREAFYQMLAALGRPEARKLIGQGPEPLDVVPLLQEPQDHLGEVLRLRGVARRIMKVPVRDADVRARFGIDHYYELDLQVPLGEKSLRFGPDPTGERNPVYHNDFPATLIARRLPAGLAEGENLHANVRADAVFYRIWTYRSKYADQFDQMQPAPLLMAAEPTIYQEPAPENWVTGVLVVAAFAAALGVMALVALSYRGSDRTTARRPSKDAPAPDFRGLE